MRAISIVKNWFLPPGERRRCVRSGVYGGLWLSLDLRSQSQMVLGLWERETHPWIARALARARWLVDVGAGRGELCLCALRDSTAAPIIAIEPERSETAYLDTALDANKLAGSGRLIVLHTFASASGLDGCVAVDTLPIDRTQRGFLKIDVEGAEVDVLESARATLTNGRVDLLIETHSAALERACIDYLVALGYATTVVRNAWWRRILPELRPATHNRWLWATKP